MDQADTEVIDRPEAETTQTTDADDAGGNATGDTTQQVDGEGSETDQVVITIGEESPPSDEEDETRAPTWVRELRKTNRELQRENRDLKQKQTTAPAETAVVIGEKPTLADCDYDEERFERDLLAFEARKRTAGELTSKRQKDAETAQAAWRATLDTYETQKRGLKVQDADDAEAAAKDVLSVTQQGLILQGAESPAVLIYALGRNPAKAKELAAITDPVKFAFAVAKLETQLKVTPRRSAPTPERVVSGNARSSGVVDSELERLRADADRTGDRTKVAQHMKNLKAKQRA